MLQFFRDNPEATPPRFATAQSACFDLSACITSGMNIKTFKPDNLEYSKTPFTLENGFAISIQSGERVLVPTGLILDIPEGYSVRLHVRSSLALKKGLTLANAEGVIDSDYVLPTYVMLYNSSNNTEIIRHGDRICQGELVQSLSYNMGEILTKPRTKTDRTGGFGSTGA